MPAADFDAAAGNASLAVQIIFQDAVDSLTVALATWLSALATNLDPQSVPQRTVLDWVAPGSELMGQISSTKADQTQIDANELSIFVWRTCKAIQYADDDNRISSAQTTALLAAFNAAFPY